MKPARVQYYFDADVMGLGKSVARLRGDSTYPGDPGTVIHGRARPPCVVTDTSTPDEEWIPAVTRAGLLIVTRDSHIQTRPAELNAVKDHGARLVSLVGRDAKTVWSQLEVLLINWRRIEVLVGLSGPVHLSGDSVQLQHCRVVGSYAVGRG